jgi:hypothetical protein
VTRTLKAVLALALLFTVAFVLISPVSDLDPSALRAAKAALALALSILGNAYLLIGRALPDTTLAEVPMFSSVGADSLLNFLCSRIC